MNCLQCDAEFDPIRPWQKYHSHNCRQKAYRQRLSKNVYSRCFMRFQEVQYGDYSITTMYGDEFGCAGYLLVSIVGPGLPSLRLTENGVEKLDDEQDGPFPQGEKGIILFGRNKHDRPRLPMNANIAKIVLGEK